MKYLLLFLLTIISLSAFAQSQKDTDDRGSVKSRVYDLQTKETIAGASIVLRSPQDSIVVTGTSSDEGGSFRLQANLGKYILEVSFLGYYTFHQNIELTKKKPVLSLDSILLTENSTLLKDVIVEAKVPDITMKGDTVEYNAGAYLMDEHALLKDLIQNIPGAEIDENGSIKINGKTVNKILIDGKEFFGTDINTALENLPANMIKKLQLYNKESEISKITGVKDEGENPVLDLIVKDEFKMTFFGNAMAGYGTDDRHNFNTFVNSMNKTTNISFIGNINNVNTGFADMGGMSLSGGTGENKEKETGLNISYEPSEKLSVEGSVRYSDHTNETESRDESQTFMQNTGDRFGKGVSFFKNNNKSFSSNFNIRWEIDSLTMLTFRTTQNFSNSKSNSSDEKSSYIVPDSVTSGISEGFTKNDRFSTDNNLSIARNLGKEGRSVSLNLGYSLQEDKGDGTNNSITKYPDSTPDLIIDQKKKTDNNAHNLMFSVSYNEPLGKNKILSLSYNFQKSNSDRENDTRKQDPLTGEYTMIDSAYTRNTENKYINHDIRLRFQGGKYNDPWFYSLSFGLNPSISKNKVTLLDSLVENLKQNTLDYSPRLMVRRSFSEKANISLHYSASTSHPGISQLSADTIIFNALNKQVGNPDLRTTFRNDLSLDYNRSDSESGRSFSVRSNFSYTFNDIIADIVIDNRGNSITTYRNVDGQISSYLYIMFNTPFKNKKFSISINPNATFNKYIGYTNGEKSITKSYSTGGSINLSFNDKKFRNFFRSNVSHRWSDNNLTKQQNIKNTILSLGNRTSWDLPYGFSIANNINFTYRWGFGSDYKKSELIWNPAVSKKLMKGNKGLIKIEAFDVLDERTNLLRYENSIGINQTWTNGISRYVMVSFSYRFQTSNSGNQSRGMYHSPMYLNY